MNDTSLRVFAAICETGSFTKAANELFITQPAVSRHVQALEHHYGVSLFERRGRSVALTANGEILHSKTRELFSLYDELEDLFEDIVELKRGRITIAASAIMATYMLPSVFATFKERYPGIQIEMLAGNTHEVNRLVDEGLADMGFAGSTGMDRRRLEKTLIHTEPLVIVAASNDELSRKKAVYPKDMSGHTFVWREKGTQTRVYVRRLFRNKEMSNDGIVVGRVETAKRLAEKDGYLTALPYVAVKREVESGLFAKLNVVGFDSLVRFDAVVNTSRHPSTAALAFLRHLSEQSEFTHSDGLTKMVQTLR